MARRDYRPASFRGVPFVVSADDRSSGRHIHEHQFPKREDNPWAEDLGKQPTRFQVDGYVVGEDYAARRDALIAALERPGAGQLQHPWYGAQSVVVPDYRCRLSDRRSGVAEFSITFIKAGATPQPGIETDTVWGTLAAASAAFTAVQGGFTSVFNLVGAPDWLVSEAAGLVGDLVGAVGDVAGTIIADAGEAALFAADALDLASNAGGLVLDAASLGNRLTGFIGRLPDLAVNPIDAAGGLLRLATGPTASFVSQFALPAAAAILPGVRQGNWGGLVDLATRGALVAATQAATAATFDSVDEALDLRNGLAGAFDGAMVAVADAVTALPGTPAGAAKRAGLDAVYRSMGDLRTAFVADLTHRSRDLPRLMQWVLPATGPSLVAAWQLYGDAGRGAELVARNAGRIVHPGFAPGGNPLEVLSPRPAYDLVA